MKTYVIVPELAQAIIIACEEVKDQYAQTYLKAIPQALAEGQHFGSAEQGLRTQLLYCLSNMTHWRGETAKKTKKIIKKYAQNNTLHPILQGVDNPTFN